MSRPNYPFAAIVGQPEMKTALLLCAVDPRLGVLLRGDKGSGKSTAARAVADLLPDDSPFVNLPLGATEDRLLGGLDLGRAMKGEEALRPGILFEAHNGVVYVDEVNLLPDHLADSLLDVASGGVMFVEREGFSRSRECRFILLGSMNAEEGNLRPQLLDRFAFVVEVSAPMEPSERRCVVERRLAYESDPASFIDSWRTEQDLLRSSVRLARQRLTEVRCAGEILEMIGATVAAHGVRSLRADLAITRGSIALAALESSPEVREDHVQSVLPLALGHRTRRRPGPVPEGPHQPPPEDAERESSAPARERIFTATPLVMPRIPVLQKTGSGPVIAVRKTEAPLEPDGRATVAHSIRTSGQTVPSAADWHERVREARPQSRRFLFIVDSSGSHAAKERMRLVKGAVTGLLASSSKGQDETAVVTFRGASAQVIVEPTKSSDAAARALEYLPTGGRTPLAHGLELARQYVTPDTILILLTDGRANVPSITSDAWADARSAAQKLQCPGIVIDTAWGDASTGRCAELAKEMGATLLRLDEISGDEHLVLTLRSMTAGSQN